MRHKLQQTAIKHKYQGQKVTEVGQTLTQKSIIIIIFRYDGNEKYKDGFRVSIQSQTARQRQHVKKRFSA